MFVQDDKIDTDCCYLLKLWLTFKSLSKLKIVAIKIFCVHRNMCIENKDKNSKISAQLADVAI